MKHQKNNLTTTANFNKENSKDRVDMVKDSVEISSIQKDHDISLDTNSKDIEYDEASTKHMGIEKVLTEVVSRKSELINIEQVRQIFIFYMFSQLKRCKTISII